jgi:hypothetical protein
MQWVLDGKEKANQASTFHLMERSINKKQMQKQKQYGFY